MKVKRETIAGMFIVLFLAVFYVWNSDFIKPSYVKEPYVEDRFMLDTLVTIKAYGQDGRKVEKAVEAAFSEMDRIEKMTNYFDAKSELSRINRSTIKQTIAISPEMVSIIGLSLRYYQKTYGAFDITIAPLMDLWSFGRRDHRPAQAELDKVLPEVDSGAVQLDKSNRKLSFFNSKIRLDLGGVAKGYAVDRAISLLKKHGIRSALVTTGSTTRVIGEKPGHKPWQIGVEDPRHQNELIGILEVKDGTSVSTSGDYQQYFLKKDQRYHHILDPETGWPAADDMSVTIVTSRSCAEADILSTAVFVLGYPAGMEYVEQNPDLEALIVTIDGQARLSNGLKGRVKELKKAVNRKR